MSSLVSHDDCISLSPGVNLCWLLTSSYCTWLDSAAAPIRWNCVSWPFDWHPDAQTDLNVFLNDSRACQQAQSISRWVSLLYCIVLYSVCNAVELSPSLVFDVDLVVDPNLPIDSYRSDILDKISRDRVVIIHGETGCGKSSRLPVILYEHAQTTGQVRV